MNNNNQIMNIAYQGIPGAYSYIATTHLFPDRETKGYSSFDEIFESIKHGETDQAVLPIENALIGSIYEVYDLLFEYNYSIVGELFLKIDHALLCTSTASLESIREVYSHRKALDQCKKFFNDHPGIKPVVYEDTAAAAKYVAEKNDPTLAAVASISAGNLYGLVTLKKQIQTNIHNYTRFVIVQKNPSEQLGDKTSVVFSTAHEPGSLIQCLLPFDQEHLNLTKIESRPLIGSPWKYLFYLDFEHGNDQQIVDEVLTKVKPSTSVFRRLGTYKGGETINET